MDSQIMCSATSSDERPLPIRMAVLSILCLTGLQQSKLYIPLGLLCPGTLATALAGTSTCSGLPLPVLVFHSLINTAP